MKRLMLFCAPLMLAACATQDEQITQDVEQAVRDFIDVGQLHEVDEIRTGTRDRWEKIDQNFILYTTNNQIYLVEFVKRCWELDELPVVPDVRQSTSRIRARFDTIRGCRIARLFALNEGQTAELKNIGESPGSRN